MRVGIDGTPLLGPRTGIGRYVDELLRALATAGTVDLTVTAFTARGAGELPAAVPPGVAVRARRAPARALQAAWSRGEHPRIGLLTGRTDVFHGTNFVLPPTGRAGGVVTVHDLAYLRLPGHVSAASRRFRELVPRSLARAAVVCVPSAAVAAEVEDAYPAARGRVVVTPLGVDPAWARTARPAADWLAARGIDRPYLLFTGTLEPRKDLPTLLRAYRALADADAPPALVLVGPAGWGPDLDVDAGRHGTVVRLGRVPEDELRALVAGARALIYPSLYEGFGLPLLEAFACGTAVVASDIPTTREVLGEAHGLAALFPVGDDAALAERLRELPGDGPEERAGRQRHAATMTWSRTAAATLTAYERALGG